MSGNCTTYYSFLTPIWVHEFGTLLCLLEAPEAEVFENENPKEISISKIGSVSIRIGSGSSIYPLVLQSHGVYP